MANHPLQFEEKTKFPKDLPLSPSDVTTFHQRATITVVLAPLWPFHYFNGELTDGQLIIQVVGFNRAKQQKLQSFCNYSRPVTLRACHIQQTNSRTLLKWSSKLTQKFAIRETVWHTWPKIAGSSVIQLNQVNQLPQHERVPINVSVAIVMRTSNRARRQRLLKLL